MIQRLVAAFASWFPVYYVPLVYAIASAAIGSVSCSLFALPIFRHILQSDRMRMVVCILIAVAPRENELIGTLVNAPWYLLLAGSLLVFRSPSKSDEVKKSSALQQAARIIGWGVLGLLLALTMPVLIFCIPFCIWNIVRRWNSSRIYEVCLTIGLALQFWLFVSFKQPPADIMHLARMDMLIAAVFVGFIYRVVMTTMLGSPVAMIPAVHPFLSPQLVVLISTVVWLTALWLKSDSRKRRIVEIALYVAGSSLFITLGGRNVFEAFDDINSHQVMEIERYFFMASCVFILLLALTIEKLLRGRHVALRMAALTSTVAIGIVLNYHCPPFQNMYWGTYARQIQHRVDRHELGQGQPPIVVPILPPPWKIFVN